MMVSGVGPDDGTATPETGAPHGALYVRVRRCIRHVAASRLALALLGAAIAPAALPAQMALPVTLTAHVDGGTTLQATHLIFGEVEPGATVSVPAQPSAGSGSPGRISVRSNVTLVTVSVPSEMTLTGPGGSITARLECGYAESVEAPDVATFDCDRGFSFQPAAGRQHVIFVGGSIGAAQTRARTAGAYTGTVTVTATYSSS